MPSDGMETGYTEKLLAEDHDQLDKKQKEPKDKEEKEGKKVGFRMLYKGTRIGVLALFKRFRNRVQIEILKENSLNIHFLKRINIVLLNFVT